MATDTTTQLNPGTGGDQMDESLVTQSDGVTQAKRPRVVPAHDDGRVANKYAPSFAADEQAHVQLDQIARRLDDIYMLLLTALSR